MRHPSLPSTLTDENLKDWLAEHCIEKTNHVLRVDYSPEEIQEFEHQMANNTNAILELEDLKKAFNDVIKEGTDVEHNVDGTVSYLPKDFTIPPSKGIKALKNNIEFLNEKRIKGYEEQVTPLFLIPVPETEMIIAVDSTGTEYPEHSKKMTPDQANHYNSLFKEEGEVPIEEVVTKPKKQRKQKDAAFGDDAMIEPIEPLFE